MERSCACSAKFRDLDCFPECLMETLRCLREAFGGVPEGAFGSEFAKASAAIRNTHVPVTSCQAASPHGDIPDCLDAIENIVGMRLSQL